MVHCQYPSMERQDLTQGQLGSFKFTPVDEAVYHAPRPSPHPLMLQQYNESLQNAGFDRQFTPPNIAADPSFFNHNIRPSLDTSRLRLGPAAVRSAVESVSSSPQRRVGRNSQSSMRPNAQAFRPQTFGFSESDSLPSMYLSEGSSGPMGDDSVQAFAKANASLLRALESEQEAHQSTKSRLEHEGKARCEAEAETRRLAEHNKGLLNSIKLLQSTVKHMTQKENLPSTSVKETVSSGVKLDVMQADNAGTNNSILYDVLSNYKVPHKTVTDDEETTSVVDLDLLSTPDSKDKSDRAQMQRTLRRQMGLSSEHDEASRQNGDMDRKEGRLLPEIGEGPTKIVAMERNGTSVNSRQFQSNETPVATNRARSQTPEQTDPSSEFVYDLPAAFLSKYAKKPADAPEALKIAAAARELSLPQTSRKAGLTVASAVKTRDIENDTKPPSRVVYMPDSPMIDWKLNDPYMDELRGRHVETKFQSHFTDHPIRYVPRMSDENIFRTVMIDFIPFGTPYCDVLTHIRGGTLESIQLYGPIGDATDFVTARVVYTDETGASKLYMRGQDPGIKINGKHVRVWQVIEPTYPKNKELEEAIYVNGHTRILIINAPADDIEAVLRRKLRRQIEAGLVLDIGQSHDGVPIVEFTSIEEATKALHMFLKDREFSGSDFDFEDDYCAGKYPTTEA